MGTRLGEPSDDMARYLWLTDLHLNFVDDAALVAFLARLQDAQPDGIWFTGDLAEAKEVTSFLTRLDEALRVPFYFVLGNHDFYFGSIEQVRRQIDDLCATRSNLKYLSHQGPLPLNARTAIVGHDGWADGRLGDYDRSFVMMNDYRLIQELAGYNKTSRRGVLQALGDAAAAHIWRVLPAALAQYQEVILLTHVPPLREACWHEGRISDDEWAPHFTCKAMGDAILAIMQRHPEHRLLVLCGHTHGAGETQPLPNLLILTGGASYGDPAICRMFELESTQSLF